MKHYTNQQQPKNAKFTLTRPQRPRLRILLRTYEVHEGALPAAFAANPPHPIGAIWK